ncbi:MAG: Fic family protein [Candidatus Protochlamydia sp.]|nr:Fic family protein [Candidatus Protochlamydia sp.]
MTKKDSKSWPELIINQGDKATSQMIRRAVQRGTLRKIAPKIFTSNLDDSFENIIKRHRYQLISDLFPNSVISYKSAFEGGITSEGAIVLTYKYSKVIELPGLTIQLVKGPGPDEDDIPFLQNLHISSRARTFLENISTKGKNKKVSREMIEERLDRMARLYGPEELNKLRDRAREVSFRLKMENDFKIFDRLIGSFLGTCLDAEQKTQLGQARGRGEPFDPQRFELFASLCAYLQQQELPIYKQIIGSGKARANQAFFESYFSNYIEGTIFEIQEAEQIIFENKIFSSRPEDSHDILGTFKIVSDPKYMETAPENCEQLIHSLKQRHAILMEARKDKMPGLFKENMNRAGNTFFVKPEEVKGTLLKGFEFYKQLPNGIHRAIFMMFLISEVHPFADGNGRIARILMNAELDLARQCRIIIPTVYREDYLLALRSLSRKMDPSPYVKMLSYAQQFSASIPYENYHQALALFHSCNAFLEPNEGKLILPSRII